MVEPFEKHALYFVGPINLPFRHNSHILFCTDYVTKWVEEKQLPRATEKEIAYFLYEEVFVRFGVPQQIFTYKGTQFTSKLI